MAYATISKARVLINSASGAVTLAINIFFVFWLYQYLLERVPSEEFAIYPVLMTIMMLGPVIISFFASAISREIIVAYVDGRTDDVVTMHSSIVLVLTVFLVGLVAIGLIVATQIEHLIVVPETMQNEVRQMTAIIVLELCLSIFAVPFSTAFEVRQKFVLRDMINLSTSFLKIAITFVFLFAIGPRVFWVPLASLIATFVGVVFFVIVARRILPEFRIYPARFDPGMVRSLLGFGAWTSLGTFSMLIQQSTGPILLNILSTPVQVNAFFIGSVFDRRISGLMGVALAPVQPAMVSMSATGQWNQLGNTYLRGGRYALWVAMAIACPMFVFAEDFVTLYLGPVYSDTATIMRLLFTTFPFAYASVMLSRVAIAIGRPQGFFTGAIVTSIAILAVTIIVLHLTDLGSVGVAGTRAVIYILAHLVFFWPLGFRLTGVSAGDFARNVLLRGLVPSAGGLLIWLPSELIGLSQSWPGFFACGLAGGLLYVLTGLLFCLSADEKQAMQRVLARFQKRF